MYDCDVIIVGARCAGASLATFLAQRGHRVVLIDRTSFPSDTLSTHVFGHWALYRRLGVEQAILEAGAPRITRFRVDIDSCVLEAATVVAPFVSGLRRIKLDQILIDQAQAYPEVTWLPETELVDLIYEGERVVGVVARQGDSKLELRAPVVVGADGRHSKMARLVGARDYVTEPPVRCAYYAYFADVTPLPVPTFEFYWTGQDLAMVSPTDANLHCLAVMPPQAEFERWRTDPEAHLTERLMQIPNLAPRLERARRFGPVHGSGSLRSYLRDAYGPGWALVGDAGATVHPCVGAGIDQAVACAERLAEALHRCLSGQSSWETALPDYQAARDEMAGPTIQAAIHTASIPPVDAAAIGWLRLASTLPQLAHKLAATAPSLVSSLVSPNAVAGLEAMLRQETQLQI